MNEQAQGKKPSCRRNNVGMGFEVGVVGGRRVIVGCLGLFVGLVACTGGSGHGNDALNDVVDRNETALDIVQDTANDHDTQEVWRSNFEPGVERRGRFLILRLKGTPFEMGIQHGTFMREEIREGSAFIDQSQLALLEPLAKTYGFLDDAIAQSYPAIIEECRGMAQVVSDVGWTFERCLALAYGDVILEWLQNGDLSSQSCSQFIVTRGATVSGTMLHGRNLDWDKIDFMLKYPTLIVRHPEGRIPYVVVGFPGNVAPYNGMNAAGISAATNEANSKDDIDRIGRSDVQLLNEVLATATSLADAKALIEETDHMTATIMVVADGRTDSGAVFEMTATHLSQRDLSSDGVVFATNHFIGAETAPHGYVEKPDASTISRFARLKELIAPDGSATLYGQFDPSSSVRVLRDHHNPLTGQDVPRDQFDGGGTIANNGCIYSIVFAPKQRVLWIAAGEVPVPMNPYVGFSLDELLGLENPTLPSPPEIP